MKDKNPQQQELRSHQYFLFNLFSFLCMELHRGDMIPVSDNKNVIENERNTL